MYIAAVQAFIIIITIIVNIAIMFILYYINIFTIVRSLGHCVRRSTGLYYYFIIIINIIIIILLLLYH